MIFDNGLKKRRYSKILEFSLQDQLINWEYKADPPQSFFSHKRGAVDILPNGNLLITESFKGRVFEYSPSGEIVWEFYNPFLRNDHWAFYVPIERFKQAVFDTGFKIDRLVIDYSPSKLPSIDIWIQKP